MMAMLAAAAGETSSSWVLKLSAWVDLIDGYVWGLPLILTVLTLSALPTIVLFIIFQDKLVKGMMAGAVKG